MKKFLGVLLLGFAVVFNSSRAATNQPPTSAEQLRSQFEAALMAKDTNAIFNLINWEGVTEKIKSIYGRQFADILQHQIAGVRLSPVPDDFPMEGDVRDIHFRPNLDVTGILEIGFSDAEGGVGAQFPCGQKKGGFYLAATIAEKSFVSSASPPVSAEQLRSELETTARSKDPAGILALFNWRGVRSGGSPDMRKMMVEVAVNIAKDDIATVKLAPLPPGFQPTNELNGFRYFPNVPVIGILEVESADQGNVWRLPYGENGGSFYLPGTARQTIDPNAKKEQSPSLLVIGSPPETQQIISGFYTYVQAGREITETVSFTNTMSYAFFCDYIKSCKFTKNSGDGALQLVVIENGGKIFDSGLNKTSNSVVYERKQ